jgi:type I restriction enzyme S subunit
MLEGKQKQIELLAEMKQRIIADAVTHGLNPDVKMKATNIPWLPEIPEHWRVIRNKWLFKEEDEKNIDLSYQLLSFSRNKGIIPFSENTDKAPSASDLSKYKILHKGQLLENRMQAWSGMFGCSFIEGCVSPDYSVFSPLDGANTEYYAHLFRTPLYVQQFANASKGIGDGFNRLYTPQFQRIYAICPPLSEQHAIVSYITDKTSKIDTLTSKLQQEIESIKEYKQRLISDVVTGQIKIC